MVDNSAERIDDKIDWETINDAILGLTSQAILEGFKARHRPDYKIDNDALNERRETLLRLIRGEVHSALLGGDSK